MTNSGTEWTPDILGEGYEAYRIDLGSDPDGEGQIEAVLVRHAPPAAESPIGAVLYVHGFSDYFFQTELAQFFADRNLAFYALDLRKCGRARHPGQTAHYVSDLALYDAELDRALELIGLEQPGKPVTVVAHSTGGLITPLWLNRRRRAGTLAPLAGLVLNSPWFDLQGNGFLRGPVTQALRGVAKVRPFRALDLPTSIYGETLHVSRTGEWDFNLDHKPLAGFPVTIGWLNAVRRAQAELHLGLNVGVPSLVLRSDKTHFASTYTPESDVADGVLNVRQIARWSGCLGGETTIIPIPDARHDVFLSLREPRENAYGRVNDWLLQHGLAVEAERDSVRD